MSRPSCFARRGPLGHGAASCRARLAAPPECVCVCPCAACGSIWLCSFNEAVVQVPRDSLSCVGEHLRQRLWLLLQGLMPHPALRENKESMLLLSCLCLLLIADLLLCMLVLVSSPGSESC